RNSVGARRRRLLRRSRNGRIDRLVLATGGCARLARKGGGVNPTLKHEERPPDQQSLDLALIGNCRVAALVNTSGRIVWWCFPRFDSNPAFSRLLAGDEEKGFTDVVLADVAHTKAAYIR